MKRLKATLGVMVIVLAACSSDSGNDTTVETAAPNSGGAADGGDTVVEVTSIAYPTDTVATAGTVRWVNTSGAPHTVEFDTVNGAAADTAALDLPVDGEATVTLTEGTWIYHCGIHASMVGTVTVEG